MSLRIARLKESFRISMLGVRVDAPVPQQLPSYYLHIYKKRLLVYFLSSLVFVTPHSNRPRRLLSLCPRVATERGRLPVSEIGKRCHGSRVLAGAPWAEASPPLGRGKITLGPMRTQVVPGLTTRAHYFPGSHALANMRAHRSMGKGGRAGP